MTTPATVNNHINSNKNNNISNTQNTNTTPKAESSATDHHDVIIGSASNEKVEPIATATSLAVYESWAFGELSEIEKDKVQKEYENHMLAAWKRGVKQQHVGVNRKNKKFFHLADILPTATDGVQVLIDDSFTKCFEVPKIDVWNWNAYLFPAWLFGLFIRFCILFPLRALCLFLGALVFAVLITITSLFFSEATRKSLQKPLLRLLASAFVASWSGVIKFHGVKPKPSPNTIFVANHTSLVDVIILEQTQTFAIVGQRQGGVVGFIQKWVLGSLGCVWFERNEQSDRTAAARRIKEHINNPQSAPLLIFPEGTCVNNQSCVMFKKGAFELGAKVVPIAIKYNPLFSNPHWNSKRESFQWSLLRLMTSWAVVCDVWFLEPQHQLPEENAMQFANRVKEVICKKAGLHPVPWDGYFKHVSPNSKFREYRQKLFASSLMKRFSSLSLHQMADNHDDDVTSDSSTSNPASPYITSPATPQVNHPKNDEMITMTGQHTEDKKVNWVLERGNDSSSKKHD